MTDSTKVKIFRIKGAAAGRDAMAQVRRRPFPSATTNVPFSRVFLMCGGARGGRARLVMVCAAAPRSHRGFLKKCSHGRLGARGEARDSPPVLV